MSGDVQVRFCERLGVRFPRATHHNVYVGSKRAGDDVLALLRKLYGRLRLKVNEAKSAVARPWDRAFLGYSFAVARGGKIKRRVAPKALEKMKDRIRWITDRHGGWSMLQVANALRRYLLGWKAYFGWTEVRSILGELDAWIRRRLRVLQLRQWKRGTTVFQRLRARGVSASIAGRIAQVCRRYARVSTHPLIFVALPDKLFDDMGVPRLAR